MLIIAHRGGDPNSTDNSRDAFRTGLRSGADLLECDLQLSASGDIVVYHDSEFFGVPFQRFTTDELRSLIPGLLTFDELLECLEPIDPNVRLVLDLKDRSLDQALASYLNNAHLRKRVLVTSTFSFSLRRLKRQFPDLRTGLSRGAIFTHIPTTLRPLMAKTVGRLIVLFALQIMLAFRIETAAFQHHLVDPLTVRMLHETRRRIDAWTVDSVSRARSLNELGVDYLTTNDPASLQGLVDRHRGQEEGGSTPYRQA